MSPRPLAGSRLRRVLALVPWIGEHPGAALAEVAARFGVSEGELERDLELLPLCGLPPYTPDRLIEVEIVDGQVWIRFAEYFDRPLRLSADEGLALLAAGRALLAVPGSDEHGALATALDKLASALGRARARRDRVLLVRSGRDNDACDRSRVGVPRLRALVRGGLLPSRARRAPVSGRPHSGGSSDR